MIFDIYDTPLDKELKLRWWGPGEWVDEPDFVNFNHLGINCMIRRIYCKEGTEERPHVFGGHLCGYVELPSNLILDWDESNEKFDIHGGITFCETEQGKTWIGFDCAHAGDIVPSMKIAEELMGEISPTYNGISDIQQELQARFPNSIAWNDSYKTFDFVLSEVKSLAEQVKALAQC